MATKQGGKRKNAGRKKVSDKKIQIPLFVRESIIAKNGGKEGARQIAYRALGQVA